MKSALQRRLAALAAWTDQSIWRSLLIVLGPIALITGFYFGYAVIWPCIATAQVECAVYCPGRHGITYICGWEDCNICTQRDWFWNTE